MDMVKPIAGSVLSISLKIYKLVAEVKANKKQCQLLGERVKSLERAVSSIESIEAAQYSAEVEKALNELFTILNSAFRFIETFSKANWITRVCKTGSHAWDFQFLNDRLNDIFQSLSLALNLRQESEMCKLLNQVFLRDEDEKDKKEDEKELNRMVNEYKEYVEEMQKDLEDVKNNVAELVMTFNKPKSITMDIQLIQVSELHIPDFPSNKTEQAPQVYRGEFKGFAVAAKLYTNVNTTPELHQTEKRSKLHTNISSKKLFVDQNYGVKLGGLELAHTDTSLREASVHKPKENIISWLCYSSPQVLSSLSHYCKNCEIYCLGIVMWEIATRRKPFSGCNGDNQILSKQVVKERYQETLSPECPEPLEELINGSRAYECFQRPSAGVLMDKLRCLLVHLEKE